MSEGFSLLVLMSAKPSNPEGLPGVANQKLGTRAISFTS